MLILMLPVALCGLSAPFLGYSGGRGSLSIDDWETDESTECTLLSVVSLLRSYEQGQTYEVPVKNIGESVPEDHPLITVYESGEGVPVRLGRSELSSTSNNLK